MGHPIAFFEVVSPDHDRAQSSYRELFDWQIAPNLATGGYGLVDTGAGEHAIGGGIGPSTQPSDTGAKVYVKVDDLDAHLDRAKALGGKRLAAATELPGDFGRPAIFTDPDRNQVGLWA